MKQKDYDILRELRRLSGGEDNEFEMAVAVGRTFDENCNFSDLDGALIFSGTLDSKVIH